jgi:cytidylate kinase
MIIAIDGPAASGKGTLARRLADHFGFSCLDTGLLYRAVARDVKAAGICLENETAAAGFARALDPGTLDDPRLRLPGIGEAASIVARFAAVRAALLDFQRAFARRLPGAILDGRDIGTIVCPDADVKIFVTADVEERARRRFREERARGEDVTYERVLEVIRQRDQRDMARVEAPMRPADDAVIVDTTGMSPDEAFAHILELIVGRIKARGL